MTQQYETFNFEEPQKSPNTPESMEIVIDNIDHLRTWCRCNSKKQPRLECPYHNNDKCLCCNEKAEYCGKHNHLIEWSS